MCLIQQSKIVGKNGAIFPQCINSFMLLMVSFTHPLKMAGGRNREQSASRQSMTPFTIYIQKCAMIICCGVPWCALKTNPPFRNNEYHVHILDYTFAFCSTLANVRTHQVLIWIIRNIISIMWQPNNKIWVSYHLDLLNGCFEVI